MSGEARPREGVVPDSGDASESRSLKESRRKDWECELRKIPVRENQTEPIPPRSPGNIESEILYGNDHAKQGFAGDSYSMDDSGLCSLVIHDSAETNIDSALGQGWGRNRGSRRVPKTGSVANSLFPITGRDETDTFSNMLEPEVKSNVTGEATIETMLADGCPVCSPNSKVTSEEVVYKAAEKFPRKPFKPNETTEKVTERNVRAFTSGASPNDPLPNRLGIPKAGYTRFGIHG